jgi:hypothetical protein
MGKVFSPEAIILGDYPEPGAHQAAAQDFVERLEEENYESGLSGMVFGSVVLGFANVRSDLDGLGIISHGTDEFAIGVRISEHIADVESSWKVPIEASVITDRDIATRRHPVTEDSLFSEHLLQAARCGKYVVGDPEPHLLPLAQFDSAHDQLQSASRIAKLYTAIKRKEFLSSLATGTDTPNYLKLQRAFELPSALGRKLLRLQELTEWAVTNEIPHIPSAGREFYARQSLAEGMAKLLEGTGHDAQAGWLVTHDGEYAQLLQGTLQGKTTIADYSSWLKAIYRPAIQHALRLAIGASALVNVPET